MSRLYIRIYADKWAADTASLSASEKGQLIDALILSVVMGENKPPKGNARFVFPGMMDRIWQEIETHERRKREREIKRNDG